MAYGDLYQWGRLADGHEKITWNASNSGSPVNGDTTTRLNQDVPGDALFVKINTSNYDWRGATQNNNLWQGVSGINNPCPAGFRLPTSAEFQAEINIYGIDNLPEAFASPLKICSAGYRDNATAAMSLTGSSFAYYWTSTINGTNAAGRQFYGTTTTATNAAPILNSGRAEGFSVRCIKD